jgi:hypothetical protein
MEQIFYINLKDKYKTTKEFKKLSLQEQLHEIEFLKLENLYLKEVIENIKVRKELKYYFIDLR